MLRYRIQSSWWKAHLFVAKVSKERRRRGTCVNAHRVDTLAQPSRRLRKRTRRSVAGKAGQDNFRRSKNLLWAPLTEAMSFLKVGRSWVSATRTQLSSESVHDGPRVEQLLDGSNESSLAHMWTWLPPYRSKFSCSRSTSCRCIPCQNTVPQLRVRQPQQAAFSNQTCN